MVNSNAAPEQKETIVKIIVILIIMLAVLGAVYWTLTQAGILSIDSKRGCNPIAFVLHGIVSKLDCLNI